MPAPQLMMQSIEVSTTTREQFVDITQRLQDLVTRGGLHNGDLLVFVPHTTAGITINENADPDVVHDILLTLGRLVPRAAAGYRHAEGNSDSHVKAALMGSSCHILVDGGKLVLGTWQGIFLCEFDGPRRRRIIARLLASERQVDMPA